MRRHDSPKVPGTVARPAGEVNFAHRSVASVQKRCIRSQPFSFAWFASVDDTEKFSRNDVFATTSIAYNFTLFAFKSQHLALCHRNEATRFGSDYHQVRPQAMLWVLHVTQRAMRFCLVPCLVAQEIDA